MHISSKNIIYREKDAYMAISILLLVLLFLNNIRLQKLSFIRIVSFGFHTTFFQMLFKKNQQDLVAHLRQDVGA